MLYRKPNPGKVLVTMKFIPRQAGMFREVFGCDVEGVHLPLGFLLQCKVRDLVVSYHVMPVHRSPAEIEVKRKLEEMHRRMAVSMNMVHSPEHELHASVQDALDSVYPMQQGIVCSVYCVCCIID